MRGSEPLDVSINGETTQIDRDVSNQMLVKSCMALKDDGVAIFILPISFFTRSERSGVAHAYELGRIDARSLLLSVNFPTKSLSSKSASRLQACK